MIIYTVQPGDSLAAITRRFGVSPQRVIMDNALGSPNQLVVGQSLLLLTPAVSYTVKSGDTLSSIAQRFGLTAVSLLQNNPQLIAASLLRPGQEIVVHFTAGKRRKIAVNGYAYDFIDRTILRRALPYLTYLTVFGYGFTSDGDLISPNDLPLISMARDYSTLPVMLLSSLTVEGNFNGGIASRLFRESALQKKVMDNVLKAIEQKGYIGLDMDFEYISGTDQEYFMEFLSYAAGRLRKQGYSLHVDLAPKFSDGQKGLLYESHDYQAVGEIADSALLMTYEWGYTYGPPMAIAPFNQVQRVAKYATSVVPSKKIMLGLPNYGYDWILPYERGITRATAIGNQYAIEIAQRVGTDIQFDPNAQSPWFEYRRDGLGHVVWFEDVRSMEQKFNLVDELTLHGVGYWNLMRPFQQNWSFLAARYVIEKKG